MSRKIYLDDCAYSKILVSLLRSAGYECLTPAEAGTVGMPDETHFQKAIAEECVILTRDPGDFANLHESNRDHPGILAICQDNNPNRDMTYADIVRAITNLEKAGVPFHGTYYVLNAWQY